MDSDTAAFLIQRAWRRYCGYRSGVGGTGGCGGGSIGGVSNGVGAGSRCWQTSDQEAAEEEVAQRTLATSGYMTASISSCFSSDIMRNSNSFSDWMRVSASNTEDNLGSAANEAPTAAAPNVTPLRSRRLEQLKEADSLSIMSDCSELMGEVGKLMKEQLASQDALLRPRLHPPASPPTPTSTPSSASTSSPQRRVQQPQSRAGSGGSRPEDLEEAAEEARREERKANFLSLAQEFAELKRRNARALPFNLHRLGRRDSEDDEDDDEEENVDDEAGKAGDAVADKSVAENEAYSLVPVPLSMLTAPELRECREQRLAGLFAAAPGTTAALSTTAAADEKQVAILLRKTTGLSERERVLQALSMSAEDEDTDSGLASASAAAGFFGHGGPGCGGLTLSTATTASSATTTMAASGLALASVTSNGMEMCFRNDAASESDCSEEAASPEDRPGGPKTGGTAAMDSEQLRPQQKRRRAKVSQAATSMQLCFISDLTSDEEDDCAATDGAQPEETADTDDSTAASANSSTLVSDSGICDAFKSELQPLNPQGASDSQITGVSVATAASCCSSSSLSGSASGSAPAAAASTGTCSEASEGLLTRQAHLQAEAQLALAQARPMARMQLEVERHEQRSRASRDLVAELMGVSPAAARRFQRAHLQQLSLGALQVIHNDLLCRIETHNEDLVRSLIERDDLHMEQDSMLVEVEDLTRRAQEVASRLQEAPRHPQSAAAASTAKSTAAVAATSPVRRKMSSLTSRLKPNKLVSLFTGGGGN